MKTVDLIVGNYEQAKNALKYNSYFEFELQSDNYHKELDRFLWESRKEMTEYKNRYEGPVVIDLSKWNHRQDNSFFEVFLYFLLDNVLTLTFIIDEKQSTSLITCLERHFEIKKKELSTELHSEERPRIGFYYKGEDENVRS